jgi:hypothetical protein
MPWKMCLYNIKVDGKETGCKDVDCVNRVTLKTSGISCEKSNELSGSQRVAGFID